MPPDRLKPGSNHLPEHNGKHPRLLRSARAGQGLILIVDDEKDLVRMLHYTLEKEGYRVCSAATAESGLVLARRLKPDLIVLDVMLPRMDGLEFCRLLRQGSSVPVIFLTAKKSEADRVVGLKLGGDDYVTKPFSLQEFAARVQAMLRRTRLRPARKDGQWSRLGGLEMDFDRHDIRVKGRPVVLTPIEFQFLQMLIEARGKVLSRESMLQSIWGSDRTAEFTTRTVDQHIARLRKKLGCEGKRIVTVTNYGYQAR